jgi:hypothetical protein
MISLTKQRERLIMTERVYEFEEYTFEEFNKANMLNIHPDMSLEEIGDTLEKNDMDYMYISYNAEDVVNEYIEFHAELGRTCDLTSISNGEDTIFIAFL